MPFDSGNKLCFRQYHILFIEGLLVRLPIPSFSVWVFYSVSIGINLVNLSSSFSACLLSCIATKRELIVHFDIKRRPERSNAADSKNIDKKKDKEKKLFCLSKFAGSSCEDGTRYEYKKSIEKKFFFMFIVRRHWEKKNKSNWEIDKIQGEMYNLFHK